MKRIFAFSLIMMMTGSPTLSAEIGFNTTAMAYVAIPLGAKTKTSFTTYGIRFGQLETSGYYDERTYSPLNNIPTLSKFMSRPAMWELKSDKFGISSFKINGMEAADRQFTLNAVGAITAAASSINWGIVAAGTAATVAAAAATSSSSSGSDSKSPSSGNSSGSGSNSGASTTSSGSGSSGGGSNTPRPVPAGSNDDGNDDNHDDVNNDSNDNDPEDNETHSENNQENESHESGDQ